MLFHLFSFTILPTILDVSGIEDKSLLVSALKGCNPWGRLMFTDNYNIRKNVIKCHGEGKEFWQVEMVNGKDAG